MNYQIKDEKLVTPEYLDRADELQLRLDRIVAFVNLHIMCERGACIDCDDLWAIKDIAEGKIAKGG